MRESPSFNHNYSTAEGVPTAILFAGGSNETITASFSHPVDLLMPVAGWPFLYYSVTHLRMQGIQKIIFILGDTANEVLAFIQNTFITLDYDYLVHKDPFNNSGGAIVSALQKATGKNVFIIDAVRLFTFNAEKLLYSHQLHNAACTLALKLLPDVEKYKVVIANENNRIISWDQDNSQGEGLVYTGVCVVNKEKLLQNNLPQEFSFDKDYLEKFAPTAPFYGVTQEGCFIDSCTPVRLARAAAKLQSPPFNLHEIDKSWTLFLDRDGVINHDKVGSYIFNADEFEFMEGAPALFHKLTHTFARIVVVTNQRGIGRGLMTIDDLNGIHDKMLRGIDRAGGKIDRIYFATSTDDKDFMRKPNPGMALAAKQDFPAIIFSKSVMIGNNITDMEFARNAGIRSVYLPTTKTIQMPNPYVDMVVESLQSFTQLLP